MPWSRLLSRSSEVAPLLQTPATRTSPGPSFAMAATGQAAKVDKMPTAEKEHEQAAAESGRNLEADHAIQSAESLLGTQRDFGRIGLRLEVAAESLPFDPEDGLDAVGDADPTEDAREVGLDRLFADLEPPRDQLVRHSVEEQGEYFALAG